MHIPIVFKFNLKHLPNVKFPMSWFQKQRFLQVLLNNVNLSLIIDEVQQLISIA